MSGCTTENWTLQDLAAALQDMHKDNKKIAVPMFQRGKRWKKPQQESFIDSLIKGYPVGTMLFYETSEGGKRTYILVDGLQRGNSIRKYISNPTEFFYDKNISDEFCKSILQVMGKDVESNYAAVRGILTDFIKEQKSFQGLQYYEPAKSIKEEFNAEDSVIGKLISIIDEFFKERQDLYNRIALTVIPVIVYHGEEENLPEIFDRINSQGTPLDQYEVYAAAWPVNKRFKVKNKDIVEAAIKKYDAFVEDGYSIHGYDREKMRASGEVNAFEYLFGLSKYLVNKYDVLGFKHVDDDTVDPLGFELVNACLNESDKIKSLYENIYAINDIDAFERALGNSIDFVVSSISPITKFKGNNHSSKKIFHSKYQILSMISTTFKEMYLGGDYKKCNDGWSEKKTTISKNLKLYYVYDIITNWWSEGGTGKIHSAAKPNRYMSEISPRAWRTAFDSFYDKSMFRTESKQIANPKSEEYVILNCIYLNSFTAMDQLSLDKFDVEHIAPKEQMKTLIAKTKGQGLPISCIANLCYLPDYVNRSKKDKNFYQDKKYLQHIDIDEVESKYSFTTSEDLEWMDMPYESDADFESLKQFYEEFCSNRFEILKKKFCESMGIDYDEMMSIPEEAVQLSDEEGKKVIVNSTRAYVKVCVDEIENKLSQPLKKLGNNAYITEDGKKGFVFFSSKSYKQGNRKKYWYGYRKKAGIGIEECPEKYVVYGCKDDNKIVVVPYEKAESLLDYVNSSLDEEGNISHWHIVLFLDDSGHMTQLLSSPEIKEIDMDEYVL